MSNIVYSIMRGFVIIMAMFAMLIIWLTAIFGPALITEDDMTSKIIGYLILFIDICVLAHSLGQHV